MANSEQARENQAKERQHNKHLQETMQGRSQAEVKQTKTSETVSEQARENANQHRHQTDHLQQTMRERSEEELK